MASSSAGTIPHQLRTINEVPYLWSSLQIHRSAAPSSTQALFCLAELSRAVGVGDDGVIRFGVLPHGLFDDTELCPRLLLASERGYATRPYRRSI